MPRQRLELWLRGESHPLKLCEAPVGATWENIVFHLKEKKITFLSRPGLSRNLKNTAQWEAEQTKAKQLSRRPPGYANLTS